MAKALSTLLLIPLDDTVVFPNMNVTLSADVGDDAEGRLRVEVQEQPDVEPPGVKTRYLEREYRAVVEEILDLRGDDGRISAFVRSIGEVGALADTAAYAPETTFEQRIELLEALDVVERLELALRLQRE